MVITAIISLIEIIVTMVTVIIHITHIRTIHIPPILIVMIETTMTEDILNPDMMKITDIEMIMSQDKLILVMKA